MTRTYGTGAVANDVGRLTSVQNGDNYRYYFYNKLGRVKAIVSGVNEYDRGRTRLLACAARLVDLGWGSGGAVAGGGRSLSEKCVPKKTVISTKWAVSNFECWRKRRNETFNLEPERQVLDCLLLGQHLAVSQVLAVSPISSSSQCNIFLCLCHNLIVSTHFHQVISNMLALHLIPML